MSYDYDSLVSTAHSSNPDVFHPNIYNFKHSLGYDCKGKKNLCILDATHIGYIAGNYFISLNIKTNEKLYIRSMSGQGMSCLAMNLTHQNLAIGETGDMPNINIFNHTGGKDFKLVKQLHSGAIKTYRCMNFNLEGNLLASVGGNPDYMLTIWNWKEEIIMLRSKAFSQDVYRVSFSSELDGQLTTSGISHIKYVVNTKHFNIVNRFWKMASTFTGLKLQGEVGRFGKTEISDIDGYIELPDGKVLSGSEWGNMILWDGSLIKVEICRNDNKFCHNGKIMQILMDEGELITIGSDGYIKVWDFEKIDSADVSDGSSFFQMEPMNEMLVNKHAQIMTIEKSIDESSIWYAQDSNGGIWKLDLSFSFTSLAPEKMYSHHTGIVKGCSPSPSTYTVATIGEDGSLRVYDILNGSLIAETFSANKGTSVLWIEENSIFSENCIASGYSDGILRFFTLDIGKIDPNKRLSEHHTMKYALKLIHICKPHTSDIEYIATFSKKSNGKTYMVTSSKDKTIFLFEIAEKKLIPIGFINTESVVTFVDWKNDKILASCKDGRVLKIDDIKFSEIHIKDTFCIDKWCSKTVHTFTSIKSKVEHASLLEKKEKENLEQRKIKKKELQRKRDLGVEIEDEEIQSESESINEWREYIPAEPSSVLFGIWDSNSFDEGYYISMDKYDGGYLYKKSFNAQYNKKNLMNKNVYSGSEPIEIFQATNVSIS
ncbi:WD repeat-containing protein 52, partial [Intoshia linei]